MSAPVFDLLVVAWPAGGSDPAPFDSPYGSFRVTRLTSRDGLLAALESGHADAVVLGIAADEVASLAGWPGLPDLAVQAAVVLAVPTLPAPALVVQLVAAGVQDVLVAPDGPALSRVLRLAIERHARERTARQAPYTDLLTGLPTPAQLVEHMSQLLALRERAPAPMIVIVLRLEGLAAAEAAFGRGATNALRRKLAVRLRAALRAGDVIASTASDRFTILLPHVQSVDDGTHVADKLIGALQAPVGVAGQQAHVSAAAGIAQYPRDGRDPGVLLRVAGDMAALARAPGSGPAAHRNPRAEAANDD